MDIALTTTIYLFVYDLTTLIISPKIESLLLPIVVSHQCAIFEEKSPPCLGAMDIRMDIIQNCLILHSYSASLKKGNKKENKRDGWQELWMRQIILPDPPRINIQIPPARPSFTQ